MVSRKSLELTPIQFWDPSQYEGNLYQPYHSSIAPLDVYRFCLRKISKGHDESHPFKSGFIFNMIENLYQTVFRLHLM